MYQGAATNSVKGDEEKAFVLYMRYCSIVTQLKKSPAYKKHKVRKKSMFVLYCIQDMHI